MRTRLLCLTALLLLQSASAHNLHYDQARSRSWSVVKDGKQVEGSFCMMRNGAVYVEDACNKLIALPLSELNASDRAFVKERIEAISRLNLQRQEMVHPLQHTDSGKSSNALVILIVSAILLLSLLQYAPNKTRVMAYAFPSFAVLFAIFGFDLRGNFAAKSTSSTASLDSAFAPFKPYVNTYTAGSYFYIESKGIPATHTMMVGISNHGWQQQVPIPQCYIGSNAWPVPLNPVPALSPIPVDSIHFTRGAIAIAVNGVPIFNVHTNTGVDSYLDGQLDSFGGHCGRADDYHYHIAPLHLYQYTSAKLPIAYALDGYAVYGAREPDGITAMTTLDANHGHSWNGWPYHYHGTVTAPYMIANMAGQVTEDATHQLIPQPSASPVRPALTPLSGALITGCKPNALGNGYTLTYTLNGNTDSVVYSWTANGVYTFKFYNGGVPTTSTYNGFVPCSVPTDVNIIAKTARIDIYPIPAHQQLFIHYGSDAVRQTVQKISLYSVTGKIVYEHQGSVSSVDVRQVPAGSYILVIDLGTQKWTHIISVE